MRSCLPSSFFFSPNAFDRLQDAFRKAHGSVLSLYDEAPARYVYPVNAPHSDTYQLTTSSHGLPLYRSSTSPGVERMLEFGATATVAIVQGNKLVVANAGDSAAVLGHTRPNRHYDAQVCAHCSLHVICD